MYEVTRLGYDIFSYDHKCIMKVRYVPLSFTVYLHLRNFSVFNVVNFRSSFSLDFPMRKLDWPRNGSRFIFGLILSLYDFLYYSGGVTTTP